MVADQQPDRGVELVALNAGDPDIALGLFGMLRRFAAIEQADVVMCDQNRIDRVVFELSRGRFS
jgi:hypothetical protein